VEVGVDEAGQQRRPAEVDDLRAVRRRATRQHRHDAPRVDEHHRVGYRRLSDTVEQPGRADCEHG
jgi:hypothetical protein